MSDGYFGVCPICRDDGMVLNVHHDHWMVCPTHSVCWPIGSNLFSSWQEETEEDWTRNRKVLESYQVVEPWYPEPAELTTTEKAEFALAVANSRERLRNALTVLSKAVEFLEDTDPSQITPNELSHELWMRIKPVDEALSESVGMIAHYNSPEFEDEFDRLFADFTVKPPICYNDLDEETCPICGAGMQATHAPFCEERDGTHIPESQRELRKLKWMNDRFQEIERRITTLERQHGDGSPW